MALQHLKTAAFLATVFTIFYLAQAAPTNRDSTAETALALAGTTEAPLSNSTAIDTLTDGPSGDGTGVRVKRNGCCGCGCCCCRPCCCCCKPCCCCCCKPCCCCRCCKCCTCCTTCCRQCCCCRPCCCGCGCGCCGCGGGRKRRALQNLKIKLADQQEKERREGLPKIGTDLASVEENKEVEKPETTDIQLPDPVYNLGKEELAVTQKKTLLN
ncbi:unnamed protein product, partial [Mesorhabditis belari]|uniref:Uncharacterized protein n=1 Tax=Mesorhabditis belari TaxID=2138241 RepID=A0AAF3FNL6_9BILA